MTRRFGRKDALRSLGRPALFYLTISGILFYLSQPYLQYVSSEAIISIAVIGAWRYSLMLINYLRALWYAYHVYPGYQQRIETLPADERYPDHIYFIIPSYKEDAWVSTEVFQSLLADINTLPCRATLIVATGSDEDDGIIRNIYDAHPNKVNTKIIFQRQDSGKRIAMGHALRVLSRIENAYEEESITIFMDGDTYLPLGTLKKSLPFFVIEKGVGAVTTDEIAYINSESRWYKDWFELKFAQRHILFQSQALSKRVLTLTGRFSIFRTSAVITEEFISMIEHDIIVDPSYGKFRFLMGDDKSSWYTLMKNGWEMLYLPDVLVYSLESRDGNFLDVSQSLPYRWYGNTLRNNARARRLKDQPLFIRYLFWDQLALMWTSLVGVIAALLLSLFVNVIYLPLYISWIMFIRVLQMTIFAYSGHRVSFRTIPLMLYSQWIGSYIKIKAFFHLSDQKWSKGNGEVQTADKDIAPVKYYYARYLSPYRMYFFVTLFLFFLLTYYTNILSLPQAKLLASEISPSRSFHFEAATDDGEDDSRALNLLIDQAKEGSTILLPQGTLDIYGPIVIRKSHITIIGDDTILLSHISGTDKAIIDISGKRGGYVGKTRASMDGKTHIKTNTKRPLQPKELLLIEQSNDPHYIHEVLGSKKWYKEFPKLRSEIVEVAAFRGDRLSMTHRSKSLIDANASIYEIEPVTHVTLEGITLDSVVKSAPYDHIYENSRTDMMIDGIKIVYGSYIDLKDITIKNSASNPLVFERSYRCSGEDIKIDGAVNKGKKGNGYLRINKSFHTYLKRVSVKNIRHITFQWASAYNTIDGLYSEVDINFHGGGSHHNHVKHARFDVDESKHRWGTIYVTPDDASWAPPDFNNNDVEEER